MTMSFFKDLLKVPELTEEGKAIIDKHYQKTEDLEVNTSKLREELELIKKECRFENVFGIAKKELTKQDNLSSFCKDHNVSPKELAKDESKIAEIQRKSINLAEARAYFRGGDSYYAKEILKIAKLQDKYLDLKNDLLSLREKYGLKEPENLSFKEGFKKDSAEIDHNFPVTMWLEDQLRNTTSYVNYPALETHHKILANEIQGIINKTFEHTTNYNEQYRTTDNLGNTVLTNKKPPEQGERVY